MKKIIKNKVYDTDTAKLIADVPHSNIHNGEGTCEQRLYQKKNGEFFFWLAGARTDSISNLVLTLCDRERHIYPVNYEEARYWAERELSADAYLSIFGEPEEDSTKTALNIYLRADTAAKLKAEAGRQGVSIGELIEKLIKEV